MPDQTTADFQRQCDEFVQREVYVRQNAAVAAYQAANECFFEELENLYRPTCPHCGEDAHEAVSDDDGSNGWACNSCSESFNEPFEEPNEVYEWWAVSEYLADKLQERGEVMYNGDDCKIWGRCTSGQAISIDGVIEDIVKEINA